MPNKRNHSNLDIHLVFSFGFIYLLVIFGGCTVAPTAIPTLTMVASPTISATATPLPSPTATLSPTRTPRPTEVPLQIFTDVTYTLSIQPNVKDRALDIYAPEQSGEWSVIIIAHGFMQSKDAFVRMAKILAREGAVVFVPEWPAYGASSDAMDGSGEKLREFTETFNCLVRFAREESAAYTNTPERVTMVGYSMGGWLGLLTSIAGDRLDTQWEAYEASNGGPPPQVSCAVEGGEAKVNAFVGYGGAYTTINQSEEENPDFLKIMSINEHMGENLDLSIRAIQGIYDSVLSEQLILTSKELIYTFTDVGYDAQWIEVDGGHGFSSSGEIWEINRKVILDMARP